MDKSIKVVNPNTDEVAQKISVRAERASVRDILDGVVLRMGPLSISCPPLAMELMKLCYVGSELSGKEASC